MSRTFTFSHIRLMFTSLLGVVVGVLLLPSFAHAEYGFPTWEGVTITSATPNITLGCATYATSSRWFMSKANFDATSGDGDYNVSTENNHLISGNPLCSGTLTITEIPTGDYVMFSGALVSGYDYSIDRVRTFHFDTDTNTLSFATLVPPGTGYTHIIDFSPANDEVIQATTTDDRGEGATSTIVVNYEIASSDLDWFHGITVYVTHKDQNTVYGFARASDYAFEDDCIIEGEPLVCTAGVHQYTREIWLPSGGYSVHVNMQRDFLSLVNPFTMLINSNAESMDDSMPMAQYHQYIVGQGTFLSNLRQSENNRLENILNSTSSSSTASIADCAITDFRFRECLAFTFIPSTRDVSDFGSKISTTILTKFPVGYVWNFYTILLSSSTASLPVIDATVPQGVAGAGAHIRLEINADTLSYLMNATTSQFNNESAPSTATFASIVGYYWNIMVYLAVGSYILTRVMGSHVIGSLWSEETEPVRTLSGRYKEWKGNADIRHMKIHDYRKESQSSWHNIKKNRLM